MTDSRTGIERTKDAWAVISPERCLWNYPYTNELVSKRAGDPARGDWYQQVGVRHLAGRQPGRALSIGCGIGSWDRAFYKEGWFREAVCTDISDGAVATAASVAEAEGLPLRYIAADLNRGLPEGAEGPFDLIYAVAALHHIDALESLLSACHDRLTADGLLIFQEYCGPSRFQWKPKTLALANAILDLLPPELKGPIERIKRPPYSEFVEYDPSESVRSAEIMDLTAMFFDIVEVQDIGFTLTQPLLNPILRHFDDANPLHGAIAKLIFLFEETLIDEGVIEADTKVVVARKRR
jgi:SAM-dependent methyltransferase